MFLLLYLKLDNWYGPIFGAMTGVRSQTWALHTRAVITWGYLAGAPNHT